MEERHSVEDLIAILSDMVAEAWSMPLSGGKVVLERSRVLDIIDEIRNALPGDLQQARAIVESRSELTAAARRDADAIIRAAEDRAKSMVSDSNIMREANRMAKELSQAAAGKARETISAADAQAKQLLANAEARASDLVKSAEARSSELKTLTTKFVDEALVRSEEAVSSALSDIGRAKAQFKQLQSK